MKGEKVQEAYQGREKPFKLMRIISKIKYLIINVVFITIPHLVKKTSIQIFLN